MSTIRSLLMATAAVAAVTMAPSKAQAFDETNWVWNVTVNKEINELVNIDVDLDPSGMVTVQALQENIGNVTATATTTNIQNDPPGIGEGGVVVLDETITVTSNFNKPVGVGNSVPNSGGLVNDDGDSPLTATYIGGTLSEQENGFTVINDVDLTGEIALENIEGVNEAIDLPKVENIATAVANNFGLESTVASNVNVGQLNYGGFNVPSPDSQSGDPIVDEQSYLGQTYNSVDNQHVSKAYAAGLAAALGIITQGEVSATSLVSDIGNATVENAATAVGNNIGIEMAAATPADAFLVADLTQFNYANTTATATVSDVSFDSYTGFGDAGFGNCGGCLDEDLNIQPQVPIISNVATAVGNNMSISVSSPDVLAQ